MFHTGIQEESIWRKAGGYLYDAARFGGRVLKQTAKSTVNVFKLIFPTAIFSAGSFLLNLDGMGRRVVEDNARNCDPAIFQPPLSVPDPCGGPTGSSNISAGWNLLQGLISRNITQPYQLVNLETNETLIGTTFTYTDATFALVNGTVEALGILDWVIMAMGIAAMNALIREVGALLDGTREAREYDILRKMVDSEWYRNIIENFNLHWKKNIKHKVFASTLVLANLFPLLWGIIFSFETMRETSNNAPGFAATDCPNIVSQLINQAINPKYTDTCNMDTVSAQMSVALLIGMDFWQLTTVLLAATNNIIALCQTCVGTRERANKRLSMTLNTSNGEEFILTNQYSVPLDDHSTFTITTKDIRGNNPRSTQTHTFSLAQLMEFVNYNSRYKTRHNSRRRHYPISSCQSDDDMLVAGGPNNSTIEFSPNKKSTSDTRRGDSFDSENGDERRPLKSNNSNMIHHYSTATTSFGSTI